MPPTSFSSATEKKLLIKDENNLNYIYRFDPYRAVNTLHLGYKNQPGNAVTKQYTVWAECGILNVDVTWCNH